MSPSHTRKAGRRYRYYLSNALFQGRSEEAGSVERVPALEIERIVVEALRKQLKTSGQFDDRGLVNQHAERIEVQSERIVLRLVSTSSDGDPESSQARTLHVAWRKTPTTRRREILVPSDTEPRNVRPIRSETRATLVASIARGRRWLNELISDASASTQAIAKREGCSARKVNMTISLAFLAPNLVKAAMDGRLPHGIGVTRLTDLPAEWSRQHHLLGLTEA
jgi:site-specific DNA recombinase